MFKSANRQVYISIVFMIFVIAGGTFGYSYLENYSITDGFYMTIITITTVGYGEIHPLSSMGRLFTSVLILFGFASIAFVGRTFVESFFSRIMSSDSEKKKMLKEISQLDSHYIICGFGRVGDAVAEKLQTIGNSFVIIESSSENCKQLGEDNFLYIEGNAINDQTLLKAGIKKAAGLLAILPSVADNLFITLTARELNPTLQIIARTDSVTSEKRMLQAGADTVISPYTNAGHSIAKMMLSASGKIESENETDQTVQPSPHWIEINNEPKLIGLSIAELIKKKEYKVLGLRRFGKDILDPDDNLKLEPEDKFYIIEKGTSSGTKIIQQRTNSPSVVIVDDNPVIVKLYVRLFRRADFTPIVASSATEAIRIIKEERPNAAVIDFQLPGGMSGIDICKAVRTEQKNEGIKLVIFTADEKEKTRERAIKSGADAVVVKSANSSEVIETVIDLLRK
ncbi:MAG: response regulator [Calditrichaeota bacterium]|nr:response regulator [Calditrichota bacterium]